MGEASFIGRVRFSSGSNLQQGREAERERADGKNERLSLDAGAQNFELPINVASLGLLVDKETHSHSH